MQFDEVAGERRARRRGGPQRALAGVRADGGPGEAAGGGGTLDRGHGGAGRGRRIHITVSRGPDDEGVAQAAPAARGRFRGPPADGLFGDQEPDLGADGVEARAAGLSSSAPAVVELASARVPFRCFK